jgi:hypothetical protein
LTRLRPKASIALALLLLVGCAADPGEQVANRIRATQSDLAQQVNYRPANFLDEAKIDVFLRPGATKADALDFWCRVVIPAGGSANYRDVIAVSLWDTGGNTFMTPETDCPAVPPR